MDRREGLIGFTVSSALTTNAVVDIPFEVRVERGAPDRTPA